MINRYKSRRLTACSTVALICLFCFGTSAFCGEQFQPRGCEFSVEFPASPKIYDVVIPPIGKVQSAEYRGGSGRASDSYFFVAEGMPVSREEILKYHPSFEDYLLRSAQAYAEANGIESPEFKLFEDVSGRGIVMRGFKTISGIRVIYSSMSILGTHSIISLRAGSAAQIFPPPGMVEFMKSVRRR